MAAARFLARAGFPWLTVDMEHTHTDIQTAALMFGAIADAGCVPLARVPAGKHEYIKMVLDCGAMGIVAPMVMDAAEARAIVAATKYSAARQPLGRRRLPRHELRLPRPRNTTSTPTTRSSSSSRPSTSRPSSIADEIYAVPGIDAVFVGPNDLASSMRAADGTMPSTRSVMEATLTRIREAAAAPAASLRPPRPHGRRRPPPRQRGLAVHRRRQRAEDHARRRRRSCPSDQSRREPRRPGEVLSRRISLTPTVEKDLANRLFSDYCKRKSDICHFASLVRMP